MRYGGNALPLLERHGRHKGSRSCKQYIMDLFPFKHGEKMSAEHACSAAAARTSAVSVLRFSVEYHSSAVTVTGSYIHSLFQQEIKEKTASHCSQVSCYDEVIVPGGSPLAGLSVSFYILIPSVIFHIYPLNILTFPGLFPFQQEILQYYLQHLHITTKHILRIFTGIKLNLSS